ncbi:unnamed protein product [Ceratitis capitata]|uniref:(Mediterranean fruit fly) hypothetical protein n=1 Tax=Ceratitis capitata TaxID=7213 RepID=A0A811URA4_CERCA|nr:unnamed protein product [Ceratitis capitata]
MAYEPNLSGWSGVEVTTQVGKDISQTHITTIFLPRSVDTGHSYALGLLQAQNDWKVLDEMAEGTCLKLTLCIDKSFNSMSKNSFRLNFRFGSILAKPWRSGGQEEAQPDPPEAEAMEEGAIPKCSSYQDKSQTSKLEELAEGLNLPMGSNSEDLILSDFEDHTGKENDAEHKDCPDQSTPCGYCLGPNNA